MKVWLWQNQMLHTAALRQTGGFLGFFFLVLLSLNLKNCKVQLQVSLTRTGHTFLCYSNRKTHLPRHWRQSTGIWEEKLSWNKCFSKKHCDMGKRSDRKNKCRVHHARNFAILVPSVFFCKWNKKEKLSNCLILWCSKSNFT